jgi:hypothetical protein
VVRICQLAEGMPLAVELAAAWVAARSCEEIAHEIGHITLAQVFAALAYYHANREEIEADLVNEKDIAEQLEAAQGGASHKGS